MIQFMINFIVIVVFSMLIFLNTSATDWNVDRDLTFFDCVYLCLTSLSSVGYGDITPVSNKAKYILIALQGMMLIEILSVIEFLKNDLFNATFYIRSAGIFASIFVMAVYFTLMTDNSDWNLSNNNSVNLLDMTYFSTTTVTTCGYGDISPLTQKARIPVMIVQLLVIFQTMALFS